MRKLMLALICSAFMAGLVIADTYTIVSYKEKVLVVKDKDDKEVKATATDKTKVTITDKDGNKKEGKLEDIEKRLEQRQGRRQEGRTHDRRRQDHRGHDQGQEVIRPPSGSEPTEDSVGFFFLGPAAVALR